MEEQITIGKKQKRNALKLKLTFAFVLVIGTLLTGCTSTKSESVKNKTQSIENAEVKEDKKSEKDAKKSDEEPMATEDERGDEEQGASENEVNHKENAVAENEANEKEKVTTEKETEYIAIAKELKEEELKEKVDEIFYSTESEVDTLYYMLALGEFFGRPEEMGLYGLFGCFGTENKKNLLSTEAECAYVKELYQLNYEPEGVTRAIPSEMNEILMTYFGITLSEANLESIQRFYYKPTDSYLFMGSETDAGDVVFTRGCQLENGDLELYYFDEYDPQRKAVITLYQYEGIWRIKSNLPLNEDGTVAEGILMKDDYGTQIVYFAEGDGIGQGERYYFSAGLGDGELGLIALNRSSGTILWEVSVSDILIEDFALGADGTIYLCGYLWKDNSNKAGFMAIDKNGNVLTKIDDFDPEYPFGYHIECFDNYVEVSLCSEDPYICAWDARVDVNAKVEPMATDENTAVYRVNLDDYSYERVK